MARRHSSLPPSYSAIKVDEHGDEYVVHKPTGTIYYIRRPSPDIETLRRARIADERVGKSTRAPGDVTVYGGHGAVEVARGTRKPKMPATLPLPLAPRGPTAPKRSAPRAYFPAPARANAHFESNRPRAVARFDDDSKPRE